MARETFNPVAWGMKWERVRHMVQEVAAKKGKDLNDIPIVPKIGTSDYWKCKSQLQKKEKERV